MFNVNNYLSVITRFQIFSEYLSGSFVFDLGLVVGTVLVHKLLSDRCLVMFMT